MKRNDNVREEDDMLISQWDGETTDDTGKNVEELSSTVELVVLVNECKEALVDGLSNHLSSRHELGVQLVQDVFQVVSFDRLFRVEQLQELLNELRRHIYFQ